jgi:hypothetical protein
MWEEIQSDGVLTEGGFASLFQLGPYLANLGGVFEKLEKLPVEERAPR